MLHFGIHVWTRLFYRVCCTEQAGFPPANLKGAEAGLARAIKPFKAIAIDEKTTESNANQEIEYLKEFGSPVTWNIPEENHQKIIGDLFSRFGANFSIKTHLPARGLEVSADR